MKAMILRATVPLSLEALEETDIPCPEPQAGQIRIRVSVCGVCHTELDEIEGRCPPSTLPMVPGHQVVGRVEVCGAQADRFSPGDRVGVAWIFSSCGECEACLCGNENLCDRFLATGRDANGGYSESMVIHEDYAFPIPEEIPDAEAAPMLCAGAIGYRSLQLCELKNGQSLGLSGFGSSAHMVLMLASHLYPETEVYVFARSEKQRDFARELGAHWTGDISETPPRLLDAVIDTTPAWKPVREALECLSPGGRLVINAIRKEEEDREELLGLDYSLHLWREKEIKSVANVCRVDVEEFLEIAAQNPTIRPEFTEYLLEDANRALRDLKSGKGRGAKVLRVGT